MKIFLIKHKKLLGNIKIYGIITFGALLSALGISVFLMPSNIVAGGVSGIGIIFHALWGFPVGLFMFIANILIFIMGAKTMGSGFLLKSLYGALMLSVFTDAVTVLGPITNDPLLCALAGGGLLGIGMGIVFVSGASTGGTDILAKLFNKLFGAFEVGKCLFVIDSFIIALGGVAFSNYEMCLYGLISLVVNTYLIDVLIQGVNFAKAVYIISPKYDEIAEAIMNNLERGTTGIHVTGMYKNTQLLMLMCIVKNYELPKLKKIVSNLDPNAFIIFIRAHEVSGEGFKIYPIN